MGWVRSGSLESQVVIVHRFVDHHCPLWRQVIWYGYRCTVYLERIIKLRYWNLYSKRTNTPVRIELFYSLVGCWSTSLISMAATLVNKNHWSHPPPIYSKEAKRLRASVALQSTLCTPTRSPSLFDGEETRVNGRRRFANCTIKGVNSLAR